MFITGPSHEDIVLRHLLDKARTTSSSGEKQGQPAPPYLAVTAACADGATVGMTAAEAFPNARNSSQVLLFLFRIFGGSQETQAYCGGRSFGGLLEIINVK